MHLSESYFPDNPPRVLDRLPPEGLRSGCVPACTEEPSGETGPASASLAAVAYLAEPLGMLQVCWGDSAWH